jgi:hypothetical protein
MTNAQVLRRNKQHQQHVAVYVTQLICKQVMAADQAAKAEHILWHCL